MRQKGEAQYGDKVHRKAPGNHFFFIKPYEIKQFMKFYHKKLMKKKGEIK